MAIAVVTLGCEASGGATAQAEARATRTGPKPGLTSPVHADPGGVSALLADLRRGGKTKVRYAAPDDREAEHYATWVTAAARAAIDGGAAPEAPEGFALKALDDGALWLLHEEQGHRRGAGAVLLRVGKAHPLWVEAPHTFFDEGTLPLSLHAFEHLKARVLLLNTTHRGNAARGMSEEAFEQAARSAHLASDAAHAEGSFFQSAHVALRRTLPEPRILQLHGYRDGFLPAEAVVSAAGGPLDIAPIVQRMRTLMPLSGIAHYGLDTKRMGGTTNVQARDAREHGIPFVHLEMSLALRTRLRSDAALFDQVLDAVSQAM